MSHYHNETMECLNHVEDQHYTDNDVVCPVCGLVASSEPIVQPNFHFSPIFDGTVVEQTAPFLSVPPFALHLGRAPPFVA